MRAHRNDPFRAAQQPGLISVNGCLMADLTGQVCAEAIDGRQYSGVGGQLDVDLRRHVRVV